MKFSILIPVYNAEKHLHISVDSVLKQTYNDFELILVNDGSTDDTKKICDKYHEKNPEKIKVIHQQNQRQLLTRCNAIKASSGDYVLFLDSDDMLVPDALETLYKTIIKHQNPDMVIYSFYYDHGEDKIEESQSLFDNETVFSGETKKELYKSFFTSTKLNNVWTKAVKRSVFDGDYPDFVKFSKLCCSEDRLHSMAMVSNADRVLYIPEPLYKYRLIEGSVTRQFSVDAVERFNIKILYDEEQKYLLQWGLEIPEYQEKLDASWISHVLYVFDLFYNNVKSRFDKENILKYNWTTFVPEKLLCEYSKNPYLNTVKKQLWDWIIEKQYSKLRLYFLKKKICKTIRKAKRKILK